MERKREPLKGHIPIPAVILSVLLILSCSGFLFLSCGKAEKGADPGEGTGNVALFITDNISFYKQVIATVSGVRLVNSGTGTVCDLLTAPVTLDISNLTDMAQFVSIAECPAGEYNRIDIQFQRDVQLMDQLDNPSACRFASYLDQGGRQQALTCDPDTNICILSIRGAVRQGAVQVLGGRYNDLGIDFDLKQFTVAGFGDPPACSVTMNVYAIDAASLNNSGRAYGVTGSISNVDIVAKTFLLRRGDRAFTVDYSKVLPALQPNLDTLLQKTASEGLLVKVLTRSVDLAGNSILAYRLSANVEGTVSSLLGHPDWTFTLDYQSGKTMPVSYMPPAVIAGALTDGAWVALKLDGYNNTAEYVAADVEVLPPGMVIED